MRSTIAACCIAVALLVTAAPLHADPNAAAALVEEAWGAWERGDQGAVEAKFLQAIKEDPANARAHIGLSLLYSLQRKFDAAWKEYETALGAVPDRYPYIFATWVSPRFRSNLGNRENDATRLVLELTERADSLGVLKGMANELMLDLYQEQGEMAKAKGAARAMNCITDWMVIGPFDNISSSGYDKIYPPEKEFDAAATFPGKNGIPASWFKPTAIRTDNWIDFTLYFANSFSTFYANTFVFSPKKQAVHFRIGTSGSFKAFLNDELVNATEEEFNNDLDTYIAATTLEEGWNRVLVKCGFSEIESCNFMLRLTNPQGEPVEGLQVSTDAHPYKSRPGATVARIDNFAERYFKEQIARNPEHLENYILLADCYLRNDKAIEAELALREGVKRSPNCALLYDRMIEAYSRGDKGDEIEKTLDKLYAIDRKIPAAMAYKFSHFMDTEEYDRAEEIMGDYESVLPETPELYGMKMGLYAKKGETEKVISLGEEAYHKFPNNSTFVSAHAAMVSEMARSSDAAIKIYQEYLEAAQDEEVLSMLARAYLSQSDIKNWRRTYERLLEISPASPGYYYTMAGTYFAARDYANAEEMMKRAIGICPNSSAIWAKMGEIYRMQEKQADAIKAYRRALLFDPTDYEIRASLRELEGKRSVFEQFSTINTDSVLAHARTMPADEEQSAVILLDNSQKVIYDHGAAESVQELVVKVMNGRGIDDWKEYAIPHNRYTEELIIDKAAVVKQDGSETKADVEENYVVFKGLEPEDVIHLKWHTKNHYSGKLSNHFFDTYYFNGFSPVQHVRYELLVPKDFKFAYRAQNMKGEPTKIEVEDGTLYRWSMDDLPAMSYEYDMPTIEDVGSILYISSIDNWEYMVEWYADIAATKSRSSFEIKEQVERLLKGKENASEEEKMKVIYNFITENIRYSSVGFRQGAHIPQKARDVLVNKIGDCKDVAALCIAMLREAGVKSHYVLVNTRDEGLNKNALPSISFNHCIVAVETPKGDRYLDLTANNYPIGSTPDGDMEAFALVIKPGVKAPIYLPRQGSMPHNVLVQASAELRADNSMRSTRTTTGTGTVAASIRHAFRDQAKKEQEKMLLAGLNSDYPNAKLHTLGTTNLENLAPEAGYNYDYEVPGYLSDAGDFKLFRIPWAHPATSDRALSYEKREHPYAYWPGEDTLVEEITITLPEGYAPMDLPAGTKLSSRVADFSVKYTFAGGKLTARRQFVNKKSLVMPEEYAEFKEFHNSVVKEDTRQLLLKKKGGKK